MATTGVQLQVCELSVNWSEDYTCARKNIKLDGLLLKVTSLHIFLLIRIKITYEINFVAHFYM